MQLAKLFQSYHCVWYVCVYVCVCVCVCVLIALVPFLEDLFFVQATCGQMGSLA